MLRFLTAGESHGQALVVTVEGLPAGLAITEADIQRDLARRRLGFGRGPRMRFEADELALIAGIRHGRTIGSPVAIEQEVARILGRFGHGTGHVFNLGHGVSQYTNPEHVAVLVDAVHRLSKSYHQ